MSEVFYFGCIDRVGHYLWIEQPVRIAHFADLPHLWPFHSQGWDLDGKYAPPGPQVQSLARLVHVGPPGDECMWTVLAMWDRSVDNRSNSNSVFVIRGNLTFDEMCAEVHCQWPKVWNRINSLAPVVEWKEARREA